MKPDKKAFTSHRKILLSRFSCRHSLVDVFAVSTTAVGLLAKNLNVLKLAVLKLVEQQ